MRTTRGCGRRLLPTVFVALGLAIGDPLVPGAAQRQAPGVGSSAGGDWPLHNLDLHNSRFSALDQISTSNAGTLVTRWAADLPKGTSVGSATPVVLDGVMYLNAGSKLFALDAATGKQRWARDLEPASPQGGRGPAYGDGTLYVTSVALIYAVDVHSHAPVASFGRNGVVNVAKAALEFKDPGRYAADFDPASIGYMISSAPTYANGMLFIGLAQADSLIPGGLVVALDGRSGRITWVFRAIPQAATDDGWDIAKDTWRGGDRLGGGLWTQPAVDPDLGIVYVNVSNPSPNFDGSSRKGANLFTNSIVALNLVTGKLLWHFQTLHHDIWDWDLVTGPTLFDVPVNGKRVKALASLAKTCYVFAVDRESGRPMFAVVETPVPMKTDVPGEEVWPTQPIPYTARDVPQMPFCATYPPHVSDPELAARRRPIFHPFQVNEFLIVAPGVRGGPNRGSSSFSPRTGLLYVTGMNDANSVKVKPVGGSLKPGPGSPGQYGTIAEQGKSGVTQSQNVAAFNPATGDLAWVTELPGITHGGNLVTAGEVVFQAIGREFYALDAKSGARLTHVSLGAAMTSSPLTYVAGGRQYVALASGSTVVAVGLP